MHQNDRRIVKRLDQPRAQKAGNQGLGIHVANCNKSARPFETFLYGQLKSFGSGRGVKYWPMPHKHNTLSLREITSDLAAACWQPSVVLHS